MDTKVLNIDHSSGVLTAKQSAVVRTLLYFDIFQYPLTADEVQENCLEQKIPKTETDQILTHLASSGLVQRHENFYFINGTSELIPRRIDGNKRAEKYLQIARRYTKIISTFPFVEAVFLSGSLAKGSVAEDGDIDYFIITRPGRLWLCRTLLIAFKKVFLFNSHKYFCVNYFIDSNNLEVPDKNIFTATELVFARPVYNKELCKHFLESNSWSFSFYPNKLGIDLSKVQPLNNSLIKRLSEYLLNGRLGEKLDEYLFNLTLRHWKKKFNTFDETEFDLHMRSRKNVSKHHPNAFQQRVLKAHADKITAFEEQNKVQLT